MAARSSWNQPGIPGARWRPLDGSTEVGWAEGGRRREGEGEVKGKWRGGNPGRPPRTPRSIGPNWHFGWPRAVNWSPIASDSQFNCWINNANHQSHLEKWIEFPAKMTDGWQCQGWSSRDAVQFQFQFQLNYCPWFNQPAMNKLEFILERIRWKRFHHSLQCNAAVTCAEWQSHNPGPGNDSIIKFKSRDASLIHRTFSVSLHFLLVCFHFRTDYLG